MFKWLRKLEINRLLVERAGYIAQRAADKECNEVDSYLHCRLGQVEEKLRQLGWKEGE